MQSHRVSLPHAAPDRRTRHELHLDEIRAQQRLEIITDHVLHLQASSTYTRGGSARTETGQSPNHEHDAPFIFPGDSGDDPVRRLPAGRPGYPGNRPHRASPAAEITTCLFSPRKSMTPDVPSRSPVSQAWRSDWQYAAGIWQPTYPCMHGPPARCVAPAAE